MKLSELFLKQTLLILFFCNSIKSMEKTIAVVSYETIKKYTPIHKQCAKIQDFLQFSPEAARYIAEEIISNVDKLDTCTLQTLVESDRSLEKKFKDASKEPDTINAKIHYFLTHAKRDSSIQKTLEKFYVKTEYRSMCEDMEQVTIKAYLKRDDICVGEIAYAISPINIVRILRLQVEPEFYRQGIGSTLFVKALSRIKSSFPEEEYIDISFEVNPFRKNLSFEELSGFYRSLGAGFFDQETKWGKENMIIRLKK